MNIKEKFGECLSFNEKERDMVNVQIPPKLVDPMFRNTVRSIWGRGIERASRIIRDFYRYEQIR